jgi:hypothetical protein
MEGADSATGEAEEPFAEPLLAQQQPVYVDVPIFLAIRARVTSLATSAADRDRTVAGTAEAGRQ